MESLLSVRDVCARYQVKAVTARKYMREMAHMEGPLMVTEKAVEEWERRKTLPPEWAIRETIRREKRA